MTSRRDTIRATRALALYRPEVWIDKVLGIKLWGMQADIARSVMQNKLTTVRSCNAAGKSVLAGAITLCYMSAWPGSRVVTTAPSFRQVAKVIWSYIRSFHANAKLPIGGTCIKTQLTLGQYNNQPWEAIGMTAPDHAPDKFQGVHSPRMLVVADEAQGISEPIWSGGIDSLLTGDGESLFAIGNPTVPIGRFAKQHDSELFTRFKISAFDTPNFKKFGITLDDIRNNTWEAKCPNRPEDYPYPGLVTPRAVYERYCMVGEDSPNFQAGVLAEFPKSGEFQLIPIDWIKAAQKRQLKPTPDAKKQLGLDVARGGMDQTIGMMRHGPVARIGFVHSQLDTMFTANRAMTFALQHGCKIAVDSVGVGAGVYDRVKEKHRNLIFECSAAASANRKELFKNARAEWYWNLRKRFEAGKIDLDPSDSELAKELASIKYKLLPDNRIQIEDKESVKKRIGKSPDRADALAYAFALPSKKEAIVIHS